MMMEFKTNVIELGNLNESKAYSASFPYTGDPALVSLSSSCGCTDVVWDQANKAVRFTLHTGTVPKHLEKVGKAFIVKTITAKVFSTPVDYEEVSLVIKGTIIK